MQNREINVVEGVGDNYLVTIFELFCKKSRKSCSNRDNFSFSNQRSLYNNIRA